MTDDLVHFALSNSCLSLVIAIVAWAVQRAGRWPGIAHLLWVLVLAKLLTPPIFSVPIDVGTGSLAGELGLHLDRIGSGAVAPGHLPQGQDDGVIGQGAADAMTAQRVPAFGAVKPGLLLLWGMGSASVLAWSLVQICGFNRFLRMASETAPPDLQRMASRIARRLRLARTPAVLVTSAHLSPMVWWNGGRVRVVVPAHLVARLSAEELSWILAHELSHVRRRDHLVRWLEWLACVVFWWNPVAWWARRNLRLNEEVCCDAHVLTNMAPEPRSYATALLTAVECLASPPVRPPTMANRMNGGGCLERRMNMIVSKPALSKPPRWLNALALCACFALPLGGTLAQDLESGAEDGVVAFGAPENGVWHASSRPAKAITGDIRLTGSEIAFANGRSIRLSDPAGRNVFAVDPAADPPMLDGRHLCGAPVRYVVLLSYYDFALALHMYDGHQPPNEPTAANIKEFAYKGVGSGNGKCASYYYYRAAP